MHNSGQPIRVKQKENKMHKNAQGIQEKLFRTFVVIRHPDYLHDSCYEKEIQSQKYGICHKRARR